MKGRTSRNNRTCCAPPKNSPAQQPYGRPEKRLKLTPRNSQIIAWQQRETARNSRGLVAPIAASRNKRNSPL